MIRLKAILALTIGLSALATTAAIAGPIHVTGRQASTRALGIDVSHFQGDIDWQAVAASGVRFSFIKATRGDYFQDPRFNANISGARAAGLFAGAYHFADPEATDPATGAAYFAAHAGASMTGGYLRPVLDLEQGASLGRGGLSQWTNDFIDDVAALTGVEPLIYTNTNYASNYLNNSVADRDLWITNWNDYGDPTTAGSPPTGLFDDWDFWQYTSTGSVPGIDGNVDGDVAHGSQAFLQQFLVSQEQNVPEPTTTSLFLFEFIAILIMAAASKLRTVR